MKINLIDKIRREEWQFYVRRRIAVFVAVASMVLIAGFSAVFFFWGKSVNNMLDKQELPEMNRDVQQEEQINNKISVLNYEINFLKTTLDSQLNMASLIPDIAAIIPAEVHLLSLKFARENETISIRGVSDDRAGFLKLKQSLEQNDNFYDVYLPLSSVTKQSNVEFTISFKLGTL